ncbi:hypothetical protein DACRYDRAFT_14697 [Dacryopinax primogenitus]|uniref:Uncharacterized protein n=1 Tax=Dacryopinax primogenitus (strain DJM 731) TaxID=1858805 RepID=M5G4K1_DACPD|nr:uncharacterized protein DACRYDRAFT_14697 [Dacryopinax primogenitus]EJU03619.1 hypothetical protein DACRYDRAFT_14697 [Dacryopinax primogenitus]
MTSSSTLPDNVSQAAFAGLLTAAGFFGIALIGLIVYVLGRWRREVKHKRQASTAQPYYLEDMPITLLSVRESVMKPPMYSSSPWAVDAEAQKVALSVLDMKSPALPGYSVPDSMAAELRASFASPSKAPILMVSSPWTPTTPGSTNPLGSSHLAQQIKVPPIPPPIPIPTRAAEREALARYTMPPPTPHCPITGMPLDITQRTPPPVYNASMERAQRAALRQQRRKGNQKTLWRETLKSVKSIKSAKTAVTASSSIA